jgi:hypothetical protein
MWSYEVDEESSRDEAQRSEVEGTEMKQSCGAKNIRNCGTNLIEMKHRCSSLTGSYIGEAPMQTRFVISGEQELKVNTVKAIYACVCVCVCVCVRARARALSCTT